ncbi:Cathepsin D [Grifola frondosa]|uniref:Cathepsin D n=1 Tax=Grifola frondosa TaxID=5627 RepID=A0A1C7LN74_GRIFR|nr:Cathepsin D [Grifola frondosa]
MLALTSVISLFLTSALASNLPPERRGDNSTDVQPSQYPAPAVVMFDGTNSNNFTFSNVEGIAYTAAIYVNGIQFQVILDTSESDLWIDTRNVTVPNLMDTGDYTQIPSSDGEPVNGEITMANVTFGGYTVQDQYLCKPLLSQFVVSSELTPYRSVKAPKSSRTRSGFWNGVLGLGSPYNSIIWSKENHTNISFPFLDNVFSNFNNDSDYFTLHESRFANGTTSGGNFAIGETNLTLVDVAGNNISAMPTLPVISHIAWQISVDGILVDKEESKTGHLIVSENSTVSANGSSAIFDTGYRYVLAPKGLVDTIYRNVPNATFQTSVPGMSTGGYEVPCDTKVNFTFVLGSKEYPIHPYDMIDLVDFNSTIKCVGTFVYTPENAPIDFTLGNPFFRNVYGKFNFGNWSNAEQGLPSVQLLSTTNATKAWLETDALNRARAGSSNTSSTTSTSTNATNTTNSTNTNTSSTNTGTATSSNSTSPTNTDASTSASNTDTATSSNSTNTDTSSATPSTTASNATSNANSIAARWQTIRRTALEVPTSLP